MRHLWSPRVPRIAGSLLVMLALAGSSRAAEAATFVVNSTLDQVDAVPGNGVCATAGATCTLRAAIQEANALAGNDQVNVPAGTYPLTINGASENASATGDLDLNSNLTITGAGPLLTIVDAAALAPRDRVFHVRAGNVTLRRLQITGGSQNNGGGVQNQGANLTLANVRVEDNAAQVDGGGVRNDGVGSTLTINGSTVSANSAVDNGGGVANSNGAVLTVAGSTITGNLAGDAGAGLYNYLAATATITDSTLSLNSAGGNFSLGGGLANIDATADLEHTVVTGNAAGAGGGIYHLEDGFFATLDTFFVTVDHNTATGADGGGGLFVRRGDARINLTTVNANAATGGDGGGMVIDPDSNTITVLQTAVFGNTASDDGGGIAYLGVAGAFGSVTRSAIYDNVADDDGGGLFVAQPANFNMTISKSTVSGNVAGDDGGGLFVSALAGSIIGLAHLTVTDNDAATGGGIYVANAAAAYNAYHVLLAENTAGAGDNCDGSTLTSTGWNLVGHDDGCLFADLATDQVGTLAAPVDPILGVLQDNGGATWTHALLPTSPAIDRGHANACTGGGASDQRGMPQPVSECDIGAYERQ